MSVEQVTAAALDLSPEDRIAVIESLEGSFLTDEIDPAIIERARRTMADIKSGRATTVPAEEVLDMLDRMAS
ncbi:MAG TPA: addiction module protein [Longimicrobium sp.]|nr:addiction module protein [Longimicrobium sp.]